MDIVIDYGYGDGDLYVYICAGATVCVCGLLDASKSCFIQYYNDN